MKILKKLESRHLTSRVPEALLHAGGHVVMHGVMALCATVVAAALTMVLPRGAHADGVAAPQVPTNIQMPAGYKAFLVGHASGTQNYICRPVGSEVKFMLYTPEAILTKDDIQLTSHFFSPNPFEDNSDPTVASAHMIRATWRHSRDSSAIWAKAVPNAASVVAPGAIPWLLLQVVGAKKGPDGGDALIPATFIQRVNTTGGIAPATGCTAPTEIGNQALVPYTADYIFYQKVSERDRADGK